LIISGIKESAILTGPTDYRCTDIRANIRILNLIQILQTRYSLVTPIPAEMKLGTHSLEPIFVLS
jgi:hypothetical protein